MAKEADCYLDSIYGQVSDFFMNSILLNSST